LFANQNKICVGNFFKLTKIFYRTLAINASRIKAEKANILKKEKAKQMLI
jgi:hypothetical protein